MNVALRKFFRRKAHTVDETTLSRAIREKLGTLGSEKAILCAVKQSVLVNPHSMGDIVPRVDQIHAID